MNLLNIYNYGRKIYLFTRTNGGFQEIKIDDSYYPYYYEPDKTGSLEAYDGKKVKEIIVSNPKDICNGASGVSYESDIPFTKKYLVDKVTTITKAPIRYLFLDIEVISKNEFPNPEQAKYPISCITVYDSLHEDYHTFYIRDYGYVDSLTDYEIENLEVLMLADFIDFLKKIKPDLILAWNIDFDYTYLHNRIKNFGKQISPIDLDRYVSGKENQVKYPAGISILDYLSLFKKVSMREQTYKLDDIAQKYLKEEAWEDTDFGEVSDLVKRKNINDVARMVKIEAKFKLIPYFDEIRRLSKCLWEDLLWNSRIVDQLLLQEAKKLHIILPSKKDNNEGDGFQGATRDIAGTGIYKQITKYDLSGAYPAMIVNFCLDTSNIVEDSSGIEINGVKFKQKIDSLVPSMVRRIVKLKTDIGEEKSKLDHKDPNYDQVCTRYDGIKAVVNSSFGVLGNPYFRLFDNRITASITFLVRDLLMYVKEKVEALGHQVVYWDTDSVFLQTSNNITPLLNELIQDWARERYGKESIDLKFAYEGIFTKLFILGKCHYFGYIDKGKKGIQEEIKGVEMKRASSSKYEAKFQRTLLDKLLDGATKDDIVKWLKEEELNIRNIAVSEIAFPCKISTTKYKTTIEKKDGTSYQKGDPIFIRASKNTQQYIKDFNPKQGDLFYYIYTTYPSMDVIAFSKKFPYELYFDKTKINWKEIVRRNITNKTDTIFEALGWNLKLEMEGQETLF